MGIYSDTNTAGQRKKVTAIAFFRCPTVLCSLELIIQ